MDDQRDPETAMDRFEDLLSSLVAVSKKDVKKAEHATKESADALLDPPPSGVPALDDEA